MRSVDVMDTIGIFLLRYNSCFKGLENGGFVRSPAAEWRRKARTGSRIQRRNVFVGTSSSPSSPGSSCRNVYPHREGRRGSLPPILPAPIQLRLSDWRRGTADSRPPEGQIRLSLSSSCTLSEHFYKHDTI